MNEVSKDDRANYERMIDACERGDMFSDLYGFDESDLRSLLDVIDEQRAEIERLQKEEE